MAGDEFGHRQYEPWASLLVAILLASAIVAIFVVAPREQSMGDAQRIVYLHVAVAWCGLAGFVLAAGFGVAYLVQHKLHWDRSAQAVAEVGWLCSTLTLVTGSLWAHEAWNTWWTWDPRLTTSLVLWTIYAGYFIVRGSIEDQHRRARLAAVLNVIGVLDVPLVIVATRWFRGIHPVSPEMEPAMRGVLAISAIAFTAFFGYLAVKRRDQLTLASYVESRERRSPGELSARDIY